MILHLEQQQLVSLSVKLRDRGVNSGRNDDKKERERERELETDRKEDELAGCDNRREYLKKCVCAI